MRHRRRGMSELIEEINRRWGRGRGGGNKPGSGPGGYCVCPKCGYKEEHGVGERCMDKKCPKCGTKMEKE